MSPCNFLLCGALGDSFWGRFVLRVVYHGAWRQEEKCHICTGQPTLLLDLHSGNSSCKNQTKHHPPSLVNCYSKRLKNPQWCLYTEFSNNLNSTGCRDPGWEGLVWKAEEDGRNSSLSSKTPTILMFPSANKALPHLYPELVYIAITKLAQEAASCDNFIMFYWLLRELKGI